MMEGTISNTVGIMNSLILVIFTFGFLSIILELVRKVKIG